MDYVPIKCDDPRITTITAQKLTEKFLAGEVEPFDAVVSFSSVEHSGLGRYGDALNPWGDLIAMGRIRCLLKPGGLALVGVPAAPKDLLTFNAARIYGPKRYPHLFANWELVYTELDAEKRFNKQCVWCYQPLHVLRKPE